MPVEKTKKNLLQCRCKICPSYPLGCLLKATPGLTKIFVSPESSLEKQAHVESLFCAFEESDCIKAKKGCKCPRCPVHQKYGLDKIYYCFGGE